MSMLSLALDPSGLDAAMQQARRQIKFLSDLLDNLLLGPQVLVNWVALGRKISVAGRRSQEAIVKKRPAP